MSSKAKNSKSNAGRAGQEDPDDFNALPKETLVQMLQNMVDQKNAADQQVNEILVKHLQMFILGIKLMPHIM